jgi:hypothetical protein
LAGRRRSGIAANRPPREPPITTMSRGLVRSIVVSEADGGGASVPGLGDSDLERW